IGAAMLYVSRHMPAKTRLGSEAAAQWRAFAEHLRTISFFRGNPEGRETLERYLPYTIALGIDREWLPRLAQASTPVSGWIDVVTHRLDTGDWPDSPSGGGWVGDLFSGWSGRSWPSGGSG